MSNNRKQWLLKVIAGPHAGAEIGLYAGKTLIGSDDECDVVLHDVLIAPQHLELELSGTNIVAAPLGGRVFSNGKRIRDARQTVPDYGFVSIGGTHLVIGPADGKWPLLSAADVPELEKEVETPPEAEKKAADAAQPVQAPVADATPRPVTAGTAASPAGRPAPSRLGPFLGIAAGCALLGAWVVIYSDFMGGEKPAPIVVDDSPQERAEAVVKELGVAGSVKIEAAGGRVSATGYVDTEAKHRELQAAFRDVVPGIRTKIYSLEKIASSAQSLIEAQRLPLTITSLSEGKLKVTGRLPVAEPWNQMRLTLRREVPGIGEIEDAVEIEAVRGPQPNTVFVPMPVPTPGAATPAAVTKASASTPSYTPAAPYYAAPAPATTPGMASAVAAAQMAAVPQPDPVTDYLITADTIDTPEATVAAIRAEEEVPYLRLSTGGVYFLGARLPYGGTVSRIEPESVTVIEKGVTRTLRQGDSAMTAKNTTSALP